MLQWLKELAQDVAEMGQDADIQNLALMMPQGYGVQSNHFTVTPLGPRPRQWYSELLRTDDGGLAAFGEEFFPWWDRERDARFWLKTGQIIAWLDLPWRKPQDDRERDAYRLALACFRRARELDVRYKTAYRLLPCSTGAAQR